MQRSARQRRLRRRILLGIGTGAVVAVCAAFFLTAYLVSTSWWNQDAPAPSTQQQAPDGTSMLDQSGVDYFTRTGTARIRIGEGALPADQVGLEPDDVRTIRPIAPIVVIVQAPEGEFRLGQVSALTVETSGDRVVRVGVVPGSSGAWPWIIAGLEHAAPSWGWTEADLADLRSRIAAGTADAGVTVESLPSVEHLGARASATVRIDVDTPSTTVEYSVAALG
ncbi:hypothetical protein ACIQLJ_05510 [Microbacterium sp. NPDC091313]